MAKEDFCFTYYDGDASRDKAHMNRLERGGYDDLIISQRKFGHLSLSLIKKTLGNDFESTWEALEIILKKDVDGKYFIEWLEASIKKMKKQTVHQSENGKKGGRPKSQNKPNDNPNDIKNETQEKPLGNGDGNGDEEENGDLGKSENPLAKTLLIPAMQKIWKKYKPKYPNVQESDFLALGQIAGFISDQNEIPYNPRDGGTLDKILKDWEVMAEFISKTDHIRDYNLEQVAKYRQTIIQKIQNGKQPIDSGAKLGTSAARIKTAREW